MSKLHTYIEIGKCMSYGDMDYKVSGECANLSMKERDDLIVATHFALQTMCEMWRRNQKDDPAQEGGVS